jgi:hypothetical protein
VTKWNLDDSSSVLLKIKGKQAACQAAGLLTEMVDRLLWTRSAGFSVTSSAEGVPYAKGVIEA